MVVSGNTTFGPFKKTDFATASGDYLESVVYSGACSSNSPTQAHYSAQYKLVVANQEITLTLNATDYPSEQQTLDKTLSARRVPSTTSITDFQFTVNSIIPILQPLASTTDPDTRKQILQQAEDALRDHFDSLGE